MKIADHAEKLCPVAQATAQIGDAWTLLIVRNALLGTRQFDDFQRQLGMTRHVLTQRLRTLVELDILKRVPVRPGATRMGYQLTQKGRDLQPVVLALASWGNRWLFPAEQAPLRYRHADCAQQMQPTMCCSECGGELNAFNTTLEMQESVAAVVDQQAQPELAAHLGYPVTSLSRSGD